MCLSKDFSRVLVLKAGRARRRRVSIGLTHCEDASDTWVPMRLGVAWPRLMVFKDND